MPIAEPSGSKLLGRAEAAQRLGVHANTLASWMEGGWLTGVETVDGEVRLHEQEVDDLRERIYAE